MAHQSGEAFDGKPRAAGRYACGASGLLSAAVSLALTVQAFAGTTFVWTGGSGKWSEVANWKVNGTVAARAPGCVADIADDDVIFDPSEDATVEIDRDITLYKMGTALREGSEVPPVLTLTGPHKITLTASENSYAERPRFLKGLDVRFRDIELEANYLDVNGLVRFERGASIVVRETIYIFGVGGKIVCEDGCCLQTPAIDGQVANALVVFNGGEMTGLDGGTSAVYLREGGSCLTVRGGYLKARPSIYKDSRFNLCGGVVDASESLARPTFDAEATVSFVGGTLRTKHAIPTDDVRCLGGHGTVLDCLLAGGADAVSFTKKGAAADFGGILYLTNSSAAKVRFSADTMVTGRGKVYGGSVFVDNECTVHWDLDTLAPAGQVYLGTLAKCVFGDDLLIRAHGNDWALFKNTSTFEIGGKVRIDTLDCKDLSTPRTITILQGLPRPGTSIEVTGGGTFVWKQNDVVRPIGDVIVRQGSTLRLAGPLSAANLTLEANANVVMDSTLADANRLPYIEARMFTIEPTATISYTLPESPVDVAYPLVSRPDGGDVSSIAEKIAINGNDGGTYRVYVVSGDDDETPRYAAFLWNGVQPARTFTPGANQYLWTGESTVDDKWFTKENWYGGSVPEHSANAQVYIGGMARQTVSWNCYTGYRTTKWTFLPTCGPLAIKDGPVNTIAWGGGTSPNFISESRFPVLFKDGLKTTQSKISIVASNSYVTVLGPVTPASSLYVKGDIRFGGEVTVPGELNFYEAMVGGRETRMEVLPGGSVTVKANAEPYTALASLAVDENAKLRFEAGDSAVYGWNAPSWTPERVHAVDGEMMVMCPLTGGRIQRYRGTGKLHVETTKSYASGDCEVNLGGGISFTSGGFRTVTADAPGHAVRLAVDTEATLRADKPWTYGPETGVETTTTIEARALRVLGGATLTIDTPTHAITLADPIRGAGTLKFARGARLVLDARLPKRGRWTEIATVGAVVGEPVLEGVNRFAREENADGTVTYLAQHMSGTIVVFR